MPKRAGDRKEIRAKTVEGLRDLADSIEREGRDIIQLDFSVRQPDEFSDKVTTITITEHSFEKALDFTAASDE